MPKPQFLFPVYPTTAVCGLGVHPSSGLGTSGSGSACQEPNVTAVYEGGGGGEEEGREEGLGKE